MEIINEIFKNVCQIIEDSIGKSKDSIKMEDTLFNELGIDSIDLVDILFELETLYEVELKVSDLEARSKEELGDIPYQVDGIITPEGLQALRKYMPEINQDHFKNGLTIHQLVQLFTIHSLCNLVKFKLETNKETTA